MVDNTDKMQAVEDALSGDEDTATIPQEVLDAVKGLDNSQLVENTTKPTKEVMEQHAQNLIEAEGKEARPDNKEPAKISTFEDFECYRDKTYGMWHIKRKGLGKIPASLDGSFTELKNAHLAISKHLNEKAA